MWEYGFSGPGMWLMSFGMVLWIALLVGLTLVLISWLNRRMTTPSPEAPSHGLDAMEILRQRYARGEIDTATYEQMRERLAPSGMDRNQPLAAYQER